VARRAAVHGDDVVFTYQAMVNPKTPTAYKEDFKAVESIEAVDAHTVRVRYARPYAKALQSWSTTMLPRTCWSRT